MEQEKRFARATSSEIYRACAGNKVESPNKPFYTYAEEKALEKMLGRSLSVQVSARPLAWGSLMECVVYEGMGLGYAMTHKQTIISKYFPNIHSGTPDLIADNKIGEIKCPFLKNYMLLAIDILKEDIEVLKKNHAEYYWQMVSNAILTKKSRVELICFIPKRKELLEVFELIHTEEFLEKYNLNVSDYVYYTPENIESFNYMPDECEFPNLTKFEFEVPMDDIMFLQARIKMFEEEVNKKYKEFTE